MQSLSFLPPYMVSVYGMSKNFSVQIGGIRYIIQFAGGITGGFLADKDWFQDKDSSVGVYGHYCISDCVPALHRSSLHWPCSVSLISSC